jgi:hypothetical protein
MPTAEQLIDRIANCPQIPAGRRRREIQRELRSHIEEFVVSAHEAGRAQDEIEQQLQAQFGDPEQIARGFAWVYRHERRRLRVLVFALSGLLLTIGLAAAVLAAQVGLALGFGRSVATVIASPHTVIEALDILGAVSAYLGLTSLEKIFKQHPFAKAVLMVGLILASVMGLSIVVGWHIRFPVIGFVSGIFFRAIQLFVKPTLARVAIVLVCFPSLGLLWVPLQSLGSSGAILTTYSSWLVMGAGYLLMTQLAARVDAALLYSLERIQAGH